MGETLVEPEDRRSDGRIAYATVTRDDLERTGAIPQDTEDLVDFTVSLRGVEVGLLFIEQARGGVKLSVRSRTGSTARGWPASSAAAATARRPARPCPAAAESVERVLAAVRQALTGRRLIRGSDRTVRRARRRRPAARACGDPPADPSDPTTARRSPAARPTSRGRPPGRPSRRPAASPSLRSLADGRSVRSDRRPREPSPMNRRDFYRLGTIALGNLVALVLAVPGVAYLLDPLRRKVEAGRLPRP